MIKFFLLGGPHAACSSLNFKKMPPPPPATNPAYAHDLTNMAQSHCVLFKEFHLLWHCVYISNINVFLINNVLENLEMGFENA